MGLLTDVPDSVLEEGAQLVAEAEDHVPRTALGHVTSAYYSTTLGRSIALAMVSGGRARIGTALFVPMPSCKLRVRVVPSVFYDPSGERLHG